MNSIDKKLSKGRLPNFIIIGAAKSGTTTLHSYLSMHPDVTVGDTNEVYFDDPKEPQFFAIDSIYGKGLDYYSKLFSSAGENQICGEASTCYTLYPYFPQVASRISSAIPNVKLIYIMRNPVERAYSFYVQLIKNYQKATGNYHISRTFEECIFPEQFPTRAARDDFFAYFDAYLVDEPGIFLEAGKYYTQIMQYLEYFERDQILFLMFDQLIQNPDSVLKNVCNFLAIDPGFCFVRKEKVAMNISKDHFDDTNKILLIDSFKKNIFTRHIEIFFPKKIKRKIIDTIVNTSIIRKKYDSIPGKMLLSTRSYLIDYYSDEIKNLENLLDKDLTDWLSA